MTDKEIDHLPNRIADMLKDRSILISGGSGFLGKTLIEKILRTCPGIKTIYLLIRNKKGKSPNERMTDIFNNALFDLLKKTNPSAIKKCKPIAGDVTEVDLGISPDDRRRLQEEVNFIYHSAATTRFDDTMKYAVKMNTRGTKYMLDLAAQCKNLLAFIHVSTAYVNPKEAVTFERPYPPPANPDEVINSINWIKEETPDMTKKLLGDSPNTYTYTKALGEELVIRQMDKLPVIIVRPSVVVPILNDPLPGWCNNLQGPMGLFVGAGKGIIRSMYMNSKSYADMMPADLTINGMLCATWDFLANKQRRIYNLTSTADYHFTWEEIIELGKDVIYNRIPFNGVVWYPGGSMKKSKLLHTICFYAFQIIPALVIDLLLILTGYKPILYQIQRRIEKGGDMFEYYTDKEWNFDNTQIMKARDLLNKKERKIFKLDDEGIDLKDYFEKCILCVRRVILKETDDMIPAAKRNMKIMWTLDKLLKALILYGLLYYLYKWFLGPAFFNDFLKIKAV